MPHAISRPYATRRRSPPRRPPHADGVSFDAWEKCVTTNCSTIAKLQLVKPPKADVISYFAGGPKPPRVAAFWWLKAFESPRVAELHSVELPITASSAPTLVKQVPWNMPCEP